jgi:hypothetical protein
MLLQFFLPSICQVFNVYPRYTPLKTTKGKWNHQFYLVFHNHDFKIKASFIENSSNMNKRSILLEQ